MGLKTNGGITFLIVILKEKVMRYSRVMIYHIPSKKYTLKCGFKQGLNTFVRTLIILNKITI